MMRKKILILFPFMLLVLYLLIPLPSPLFKPDYSRVVLDADGKILRVFLNKKEQFCFPPDANAAVPEKLKIAVLQYEDKHFYSHPGVDPVALVRAVAQNLKSGQIKSGASTVTMQVARLMKQKHRNYPNKLLEMLQALKIELTHSKEDILRLYLNHAPYGSNIVGYRAASLRYFRKMPEQLTWSEAAILAVLPNAPGLISPVAGRDKLKRKRDRLLRKLLKQKKIDGETCKLAILEPLPEKPVPFKMAAPHLARFLLKKQGGEKKIFRTTIQRETQIKIENLVKQHVEFLQSKGIRNGAALVAETKSGKVRAYVGSQAFFDFKNQGQVNGVIAPRSSGSLLKPFLYALCMDEGILLPQTKIKDIPSYYGSFSPSNASLKYDGMVSARDALIRSLNVPAVRLLYTYGVDPFYSFLKSAGLSTLFRSPAEYGLPLILGGAEVTVWDMATLFCGLGSGGIFRPLQILQQDEPFDKNSFPLISPGACYLTCNMLRRLKRPGAEYYWQQYQNRRPIAWKTGTSYGQRDAWAVGVSPRWTIAVWVGNFDGEGNANLTGSRCAGPLLFDIFNTLPQYPQLSWFAEPVDNLIQVDLCLETGYPAGPNCSKIITVSAPKRMKPLPLCPYHRAVFVTEDEKYRVCSSCWQPDHYKKVSRLFYSPDVIQYLRQRGQSISRIPPHKPDCPHYTDELALQIIYPRENARLWVPRDLDGNYQKVLFHIALREKKRTVFWYLDDRYAGSSKEKPAKAFKLTRGWHRLEVVDENGNRARVRFYASLKSKNGVL